jgi:probable rRNA maturation factor
VTSARPTSAERLAAQMANARLNLAVTASAGARHVPFLRRGLRAAHAILRPALRDLSLALVGDRRMAELHGRFMHVARPTDVLTFPLETDSRGRTTAGEVVVCVPVAERRARAEGIPLERELLLYALHGMLHLAGFDDRTDRDFAAMHRTEDDILTRLGVGPVFSAPPTRFSQQKSRSRSGARKTGAIRRAARRPTIGGSSRPQRATAIRAASNRARPARRAKGSGAKGPKGKKA